MLAIVFQEGNSQTDISSQCPEEIPKHKYVGLTSSDGEQKFVADEVSEVSRETNYYWSRSLYPCLRTNHRPNCLALRKVSSRLSPPSGACTVHGLVRDG